MTNRLDIRQFKRDSSERLWEVPALETGISRGILPLFIGRDDHVVPIGTAFTTGHLKFLMSATHNIEQAMKLDPKLSAQVANSSPQGVLNFSSGTNLYVLYRGKSQDCVNFQFWPIRVIDGASPTDVVFAYPRDILLFPNEVNTAPTLKNRLSFDFPRVGSSVLSMGYSDFEYPSDGIDLKAVRAGNGSQLTEYKDRLFAAEAKVDRIFTQRFARGFVDGPCFAMDTEIRHGMSGGPVYNDSGNVCGVNSAGASSYFDGEASLASVFYPMLPRPVRFGGEIGALTLNASRPLIDLVAQGSIATDGSERFVGFTEAEGSDWLVAHPRIAVGSKDAVHEDFHGYQNGKIAPVTSGPVLRIRYNDEREGNHD